MGIEIERKFLVESKKVWPVLDGRVAPSLLAQGYLSYAPAIRVRVQGDPRNLEAAWITIKSSGGLVRKEFEYSISPTEGSELLLMAQHVLRKNRYVVTYEGNDWEVDEFLGPLGGLWVAEIELNSPDQTFGLPPWVGLEVTEDERYSNASLAQKGWPTQDVHPPCC